MLLIAWSVKREQLLCDFQKRYGWQNAFQIVELLCLYSISSTNIFNVNLPVSLWNILQILSLVHGINGICLLAAFLSVAYMNMRDAGVPCSLLSQILWWAGTRREVRHCWTWKNNLSFRVLSRTPYTVGRTGYKWTLFIALAKMKPVMEGLFLSDHRMEANSSQLHLGSSVLHLIKSAKVLCNPSSPETATLTFPNHGAKIVLKLSWFDKAAENILIYIWR